ncbi:MAG: hypothetical protein GX758_04040 [Tenericutes bacterium]|nr:hypothetical protein [Mycoplasmatota bacterium]
MFKKEGILSKIIGICILVVIIVVVVIFKNSDKFVKQTITIYGAVGGGKEDLLADEEINKIFANKYNFSLANDSWSNGQTVKIPVLRENGDKYDMIFFSDQRYYDYYKTKPSSDEAERYYVLDGSLTLNTPIVIYSWDTIVDALIKEKIVTYTNDVYYITDMEKLISYILEGKKWSDIGLDSIYGSINIGSTDPVTSSPGATYYGLLISIMSKGDVNSTNIKNALPKLKEFYTKSGYMNNTPADLFSMFLKTGMGAKPMIVDYEKSIIEFANSNPDGWNQVKDKVRILYPTPTIWNSHCIASLTENGKKVVKAFEDEKVSQISWEKYGFRVGVTGGKYDVSKINIKGIPQEITSVTSGLKMSVYNELISYLAK